MKQILQDLKSGNTFLEECPIPSIQPGHVLIETTRSLISTGTERMLVEFGKANLITKVKKQPEKVNQVLAKMKVDGVGSTLEAVNAKLNTPIPLGYCNTGVVIEVGNGVNNIFVGDRVVSNGHHAEVVCVPVNLCAKIPENITDDQAVFTVLGSIGLQGIRLLKPELGERIVVIGTGLIGLITAQLLFDSGCKVLAIDFDKEKLKILEDMGIETCCLSDGENPISHANLFSKNNGVDGVIITASSDSDKIMSEAAEMCRKRARIILVGVTGLNLKIEDFYEKELSFQVSCSYGPGRYDTSYEERGIDYPFSFVRWTEQRNFEAIIEKLEENKLDVLRLISSKHKFEDAGSAYNNLLEDKNALGIILEYDNKSENKLDTIISLDNKCEFSKSITKIGFIGAGNYASRVLIPAFKSNRSQLHTVCSQGGVSSSIQGKKNGFSFITSDTTKIFQNEEINTVVVATRHNSHSQYVAEALNSKKHVFVEKPLALTFDELKFLSETYKKNIESKEPVQLMVGFNRRFAPQIKKIKSLINNIQEPKSFIFTMNAGHIPDEHWTQDELIGGGRIIGEACHYIDLMRHLAGCKIISISARRMGNNNSMKITDDKASITLGFEDGSFGTILYLSNGSLSFPKERIEVFANGGILQLDNFKSLKSFGWHGFSKSNLWMQDKGQKNCIKEFCKSIEIGEPLIKAEELFEVARVSIEVADLLRNQ